MRPLTTSVGRASSIAVGFRRFVLCLLVPVAFVAQTRSGPQLQREPNAVIPAPRTGLLPVRLPDLSKLEGRVRDHLVSLQNSLLAAIKEPEISNEKLGDAYGLMGQLYHAYSLTPAAEECYQNAHRLAPADFRWAYFIAHILHQGGRAEEAEKYYRTVLKLRRDYLPALAGLGNLYLQQNRLQEAGDNFTEALKSNPGCVACRYGLGQAALSARDYTQAVQHLEQALKAAPEANRIHYTLAMAYRGAGNIEKARAHLSQQGLVGVRVADPLIDGLQQLIRGERLHLIRGRSAFDAGRFSEASNEFRKAVAANPDSIPALVNLGSALAEMKDFKGAIENFQHAVRIDPNNAAANYNLGFLFARQNEHKQAIVHLQAVLRLNPKDADARWLLSRELVKSRRLEEALKVFSLIAEYEPDNEEALLEEVRLLLELKRHKQAMTRLEKGHTQFPKKGRTAIMLAYLLASSPQQDLRDGARALTIARLVYEATGLVNHGAIVAMALAEAGLCSQAAEWQRRMVAAAERDRKTDLAIRLKADLKRYENERPCRPPAAMPLAEPALQQEPKRP